jgi:hypothetical protein
MINSLHSQTLVLAGKANTLLRAMVVKYTRTNASAPCGGVKHDELNDDDRAISDDDDNDDNELLDTLPFGSLVLSPSSSSLGVSTSLL